MKNKESTRYFSDQHEKSICAALEGVQVSNSGAGRFQKGDVIIEDASLLIEGKCSMSDKSSVSIKKDWILKNKEEAFRNRLDNSCVCFNFSPKEENYYVINERLMMFLVDSLRKYHNDLDACFK